MVRPVNTQLVDEPVSEDEQAAGVVTEGDDATVKPVRAVPPLDDGAVQVTVADAIPLVAVTPLGAGGAVAGVAAAEAVDAVPVPEALMAATVNVYEVPFFSPVKAHVVEVPVSKVEQVAGVGTAGLEVTAYPVTVEPPLLEGVGSTQVIVDAAFWLEVAVTPIGVPGTADGTATADAFDHPLVPRPVPVPLVALTWNSYEVPLVRPVTVQEVSAPVHIVAEVHTV